MDKDFLTRGLEDDRVLKADYLVSKFREEVRDALEEVSSEIIADNPELFDNDVSLDYGHFGIDNSNTLTTTRIEFDMNQEHEEFGTRKLNVGIEWVEAGKQDQDERDGSLCYVLYKIQRGLQSRFEGVKKRTREMDAWASIRFGDDMWPYRPKEAPGIVYVPVDSGSDFSEGLQQLREHFNMVYSNELME